MLLNDASVKWLSVFLTTPEVDGVSGRRSSVYPMFP